MNQFPAYILAGGRSSRFGADKARARLEDDRTLLEHVVEAVIPHVNRLTVIADRAGKFADLNLRTIADIRPGLGPLAGLEAAFADLNSGEDWLLLLSCDLLGLRGAWISQLTREASPCGNPPAILFATEPRQPLLALYHRSLAPSVSALLDANRLALQGVLRQTDCRFLPPPAEIAQLINVNAPSDLSHNVS